MATPHEAENSQDSDDEPFIYRPSTEAQNDVDEEDEEVFIYKGESIVPQSPLTGIQDVQAASGPSTKFVLSAKHLDALFASASAGEIDALKQRFEEYSTSYRVDTFSLANDASNRTGMTVLHAAASRGRLQIVKWLVEHCGAVTDLEDKEGETALHKAALNGHLNVIIYLVKLSNGGAEVSAADNDGWTALHNAASKGYLDIVRWLCESGAAAQEVDGISGVDRRSKGGWTPLMNAASKGQLPVVLYLLSKVSATPLIRNNWGETAYDIAASVFEVYICDVLQRYETERWTSSTAPYDPLAVHTTVPIVIYENQKLDARLKTLAVSGQPKFSAAGPGRKGRRSPFELKAWSTEKGSMTFIPAWRSDVQLPLIDAPFVLPHSRDKEDAASMEGAERSHFWLSDWTLDLTHPKVSVEEGWQYARSFDEPEENWMAEMPRQLERLLSGARLLSAGLAGPSTGRAQSSRREGSSQQLNRSQVSWVRRRRFVRVMRRRLDIPPLPFLQSDGLLYQLTADGSLERYHDDRRSIGDSADGQELSSMPATFLSSAQDYVSRARYLADTEHAEQINGDMPPADLKRAIVKLERATVELRAGMLADEVADRKTQAEVLLHTYSRELERVRMVASSRGIFVTADDEDEETARSDDDDDSDGSFHYPASPRSGSRPVSLRSSRRGSDYFGQVSSPPSFSGDLTPHLAQSSEFRVPTREAPQKITASNRSAPVPHQLHPSWESDTTVTECRSCKRRFTFLLRKHCRKCGRIFCDRCSSQRALLDPSEVVEDLSSIEQSAQTAMYHRVCDSCFDEVTSASVGGVPSRLRAMETTSMEQIVIDQGRLVIPTGRRRQENTSQISDLADCPVCSRSLAEFGSALQQEAHVKSCLEGGSGSVPQASRYLVYRLPAESPLIGIECVICLEEFLKGSTVARLSCLCSFHNACLTSWLQRGRSCPVHARDT